MNAHNEQQALPCPFCGADPDLSFNSVSCGCAASPFIDREDALQVWNTRAAQPAAAQEAVAKVGSDHFRSIVDWLGPIPPPNTLLYAAPVTAAPADPEHGHIDPSWSLHDRVEFALRDAGFDLGEAAFVAEAASAAEESSPAAPGIDLAGKSGLLRRARSLFDQDREYALERGDSHHAGQCMKDIASIDALIDASPKGDEPRTPIDGCTESNCPRCRTHPDHRGDMEHAGIGRRPPQDSPKGGSEAITDTDRLNFIAAGFLHIEPVEIRASEDDADAGWVISEHHMRQGLVELIRWDNDNLRAAIDAAMQAQADDAEVQP